MSEFQRLQLKQFPKVQDRETSESRYWKSFTTTSHEHLLGSPSCIHFNPSKNGSFMVTSSTSVHLYDSVTDKVLRSFTRFKDDAYSGHFRKDGKLLVAGDASGAVKVFDVKSKAMLRQLTRHTMAVHATVWSSCGLRMISGSDDQSVRLWDLGTEECLWHLKGVHSDYIRCVDSNPSAPDVFLSGSYDHTLKLWDSRQRGSIHSFDHQLPVENCLIAPSGTMMFSSGGNEIKIWDVVAGKLLNTFSSHQKNVTGMCMDGTKSRLLSCGLDGHVKVYSLETMQTTHGMKFGSPIRSMGLSSDNKKLVIGLMNGDLVVRTKKDMSSASGSLGVDSGSALLNTEARSKQVRLYKGAGATVSTKSENMVETERMTKLRPYEVQLKKFNYQQALDTALKTRNPLIVVTVLEELCRRSGLTVALSGRDESTLDPLLAFCARYISHPRYTRLVVQVSHRIVDLYCGVLGHSDAIDELFHKLRQQVKAEVSFHREIMRVVGSVDEIISASALTRASDTTVYDELEVLDKKE
jgi:U3 small nucleolar RNA-associated protein 15